MPRSTKVHVAPARLEKSDSAVRDACLVCIYPSGPEMGGRYAVSDLSLILGRDPFCEIAINNLFVSRNHARIQPARDGGFEIVDLQSTNGTFVNEVRVETTHRLANGDYIRLGNCIFRFLEGGNIEAEYHEEIHRLTIIDALTGIYNLRFFTEAVEQELARTRNTRKPLALVLFDLDRFKLINDNLGHLGGDHVLRELAGCLQPLTRDLDVFARYGGEEFAVLMPETSMETALQRAEAFRGAVEEHLFIYDDKPCPLTISLGVAVSASEPPLTASALIHQADEKLYEAKQAGRNRVC